MALSCCTKNCRHYLEESHKIMLENLFCFNCHSYKTEDHNNLEKSSTNKKYEHAPSGYSSLHIAHLILKNKLGCYRGKDCMGRFCKDLKEHATKVTNYEKKGN